MKRNSRLALAFLALTVATGFSMPEPPALSRASPSLTGFSLIPDGPLVALNGTIGARVQLAAPAPAGGVVVTLGSLATGIASISPASVTVPGGATQSVAGAITISGVGLGSTTLTANTPGCPQTTAPITTTSQFISLGTGLAVVPGQTAGLPVSLSIPAPAGGVTIAFASTNPAVLTVQPSIFIPFGQQVPAANPQVNGVSLGTASIIATASGFAPDTRSVTVASNVITFSPSPLGIASGLSATLDVRLQVSAPAGGQTVFLTTDSAAIATVVPSVVVPAGANSATVTVNGIAPGTTMLHANAAGMPQANLTVNVILPVITVANATIGDDLQVASSGWLSAPAPPANLVVTLTSSDPTRLLLSTDPAAAGTQSITRTVPSGATFIPSFQVHALDDNGTVTVTATAPGYSPGTATYTLTPSGFVIWAPSAISTSVGAPDSSLQIRPMRLDAGTLAPSTSQALRGGISAQVPVATSDPLVGTITVSPVPVSGGDILVTSAFTPVGAGTAFVSIGTPSTFETPSSGQSIVANVAQQAIVLTGTTIGDDLQELRGGTLSSPAPAGNLLVTLTSSDPSRLLVSASATAPGTTSITLLVAAGSSTLPSWYAQALDDHGSVGVTATAPGYGPGLATINLVPSGFMIWTPGQISISTGASPATVQIRPARLDPGTLTPQVAQGLRAGFAVNVDVLSANTAIGTITTSPVPFSGGDFFFNTGFNPVSAGSTVVSVVQPASFDVPSSSTSIPASVATQSITMNPTTIGDDLQTTSFATLSAPAPAGNLMVTLTSADPARLLVSTSPSIVGSGSVTVQVPAGSISVPTFYLQALGNSGTVDVTASAPGYANAVATHSLAPSGFIIWTPGVINTSTFAAPTTVQLRPMRLNPGTLAPAVSQELRPGLSVNVGLSSSNTNVGTIVSSPLTFIGNALFVNGAFQPLTAGTTTVSISTPPGFETPSTTTQIQANVTAPQINISGASLGRELQVNRFVSLQSAPPNPVTVTVTSNDPAVATVSLVATAAGGASVAFPGVASTSAGTVYIQGRSFGSTTVVAQAPGFADGTATVTVHPSGFIIWTPGSISTTVFASPTTVQLRPVRLDPVTLAPLDNQSLRGGFSATVGLSSSRPNVGTLVTNPVSIGPDGVFVNTAFQPAQGGLTVLGVVTPAGFATPSTTTSINAVVRSPAISMQGGAVGEDLQISRFISLETAPPAPMNFVAEVDDPAIATVSTSPFAAGGLRASFTGIGTTTVGNLYIHGRHVGTTQITVSGRGYEGVKATISVQPSGFSIWAPGNFTTSTFSTNTNVQVRPMMLDPVTLNGTTNQAIRGGLDVLVPISNSASAVGTLTSTMVRIGANETFGNTSFDPVGGGTSTIALATPPGFDTPSNAQQIVATVTAPSLQVVNATVGRHLQVSRSVSLGASPPAPITVTLTVANPAVALVSTGATTAGSASIVLSTSTTSSPSFWVQGVALGATTISISAPGYMSGSANVTVAPSGFAIWTPGNFTTTASASNSNVQIRPMLLDPVTLNTSTAQELRAGAAASVNVSSSNPAVGTITTSPLAFTSATAFVNTAFDPMAAGTTTISISAPAGFHLPSNNQQISVTVNP